MTDQDGLRSRSDIDADAERFVDADVDESEDVTSAIDLPPEGSIPDIIDQHIEVPEDEE